MHQKAAPAPAKEREAKEHADLECEQSLGQKGRDKSASDHKDRDHKDRKSSKTMSQRVAHYKKTAMPVTTE